MCISTFYWCECFCHCCAFQVHCTFSSPLFFHLIVRVCTVWLPSLSSPDCQLSGFKLPVLACWTTVVLVMCLKKNLLWLFFQCLNMVKWDCQMFSTFCWSVYSILTGKKSDTCFPAVFLFCFSSSTMIVISFCVLFVFSFVLF